MTICRVKLSSVTLGFSVALKQALINMLQKKNPTSITSEATYSLFGVPLQGE